MIDEKKFLEILSETTKRTKLVVSERGELLGIECEGDVWYLPSSQKEK